MNIRNKFKELDSETQTLVLNIGWSMYEHGKHVVAETEREETEEIQKKTEERIREIRRNADKRTQDLETELQETKDTASRREKELHNRFREEVTRRAEELSSEREKRYQEEIARLRDDTQKEREGSIQRLKDITEKLMGSAENSSKRGKVGEIIALDEVRRVFKDAIDIEEKGREGRSGDIHVRLPGIGNIILDIKHHAKGAGGVRKKDREKLLRDLDEEKNDAVAGVLVATQATIQGMEPGSILYSPRHNRPMIACELRGDWDRLRDIRSIITNILTHKSMDIIEEEKSIHTSEITKDLRMLLKSLVSSKCRLQNEIRETTNQMGEICSLLVRLGEDNKIKEDELILSKLVIGSETTKKPLNLRSVIPKKGLSKKRTNDIRNFMISSGVIIKENDDMINVALRE
jgi:hypothetical protein